ncbi:hypothetical protein [Lichenibacterium ramalinae]|uniref:hypothetical protein n=1 Tax=Lichenibacterium ramalinae TaxID=2316527 RepID=UPI00100E01FC|nr:hypothetical protein [Lichenibacterium ramalinae]
MAHSKKKPAPPCQAATGLSHNIPVQLTSYVVTDNAALTFRQVPIGVIRLAQRFGLSVSTAAAVVEANGWGCCS